MFSLAAMTSLFVIETPDYIKLARALSEVKEELPVLLIWGDAPEKLKEEKVRLEGLYKCVCAVGEKNCDKYLAKHEPSGVLYLK